MSTLVRSVQRILEHKPPSVSANEQFVRLRDFLKDMQDRGLVVTSGYGLPLVDTVGRPPYRQDR